ncbi:alpha/beta fold hydrolase [Teichococcus vastitatis]|uniref:Alpha/beta hydrolase n=1 Tax=Teichococcus vastitatis TaxID=2307076 RepID=A0ABS9W3Z4_9PROT|nr:alpha/beta fold hydrolase [Pseudoroseomonas vastitatis]MCI0753996.1 alpha/beta hydrolase [Pseudoroseomonas vastitatis]
MAACTPQVIPAGPEIMPPAMAAESFVMADGAALPLRAWLPDGPPRAVVLALHGFGDTAANAFRRAAEPLGAADVALYAYDQRGFGAAPHRGVWPGSWALAGDATRVAQLLRARHPGVPLFLLGESMGGAVALVAAASANPPPVDGLVLVAPAVQGRASMGWLPRNLLDFAAHTVPLLEFRNSAPGFAPTDDEDAMRGWGRDPLTYKEVRVDALFGLVGLMDQAARAVPARPVPVLLLYGAKDRIIAAAPVRDFLRMRAGDPALRAAYYPEGYHMLLRDKGRAAVAADLLAWMAAPGAPLPSGADRWAAGWLAMP